MATGTRGKGLGKDNGNVGGSGRGWRINMLEVSGRDLPWVFAVVTMVALRTIVLAIVEEEKGFRRVTHERGAPG